MIHHLFRSIGHFLKQHQVAVRVVARTLPVVVREIDKWISTISTASYQEAVQNVKLIEQDNTSRLFQIFTERKHDMNDEVRRCFEERLRALGKIP